VTDAAAGSVSVTDATRRYALLSFLQWLPVGLTIVPMVLLLLERGFTLAEIAAIGAVSGVTVAAFELPTGGLADVVGRKPVLVTSALAHACALVMLGLATSVTVLLVSAALRGLARALSSGPLEAWYVDTVHAGHAPAAREALDLTWGLARGEVAASVALAVGTMAGGLLPLLVKGANLPVPALAIPVLLAAMVEIVRVAVTLWLPDEPRTAGSLRSTLVAVPATIGTGVRLAASNALVLRLLVVGATLGVALAAIELVTPGWLGRLNTGSEVAALAYAGLATAGFAADAVGGMLAPLARRRLRTAARAAAAAAAVVVAGALGLVAASLVDDAVALAVAAVAYVAFFVGLGIAGPPMADLLHSQVTSSQRATVLSVQSLTFQITGAGGAILAGWLTVRHGPAAGFAVAAGSLSLALWLLVTMRGPARPFIDDPDSPRQASMR
jgi:sugar phosphate permease